MVRDKIIEATLALFRSYKSRRITMDDVARSIGISKRTLYEHFSNKEELFRECIKYRVERERLFVPSEVGLLDMLLDYQAYFRKLPVASDYYLSRNICHYHYNLYKYMFEYILAYNNACMDKINDSISQGYIEEKTSKDLISAFILNNFSLLFSENRVYNLNDNEVIAETVLVFMKGISTPKGREYINEKIKKYK